MASPWPKDPHISPWEMLASWQSPGVSPCPRLGEATRVQGSGVRSEKPMAGKEQGVKKISNQVSTRRGQRQILAEKEQGVEGCRLCECAPHAGF